MKKIIVFALLLLHLTANSQESKLPQDKITALLVEILKNIGNRRGNNGLVSYPRFSTYNIRYIKPFITDGGLNEIKNCNEWLFMNEVDTSNYFIPKSIQYKKIRKDLKLSDVSILRIKNKSLELTPFFFSDDFNKVCFITQDISFPGNHVAVSLNKIICFYQYVQNGWVEVLSYPVVLE